MTVQTINIGTIPNDTTGDSLRTAFRKVNDNFLLLQTEIDERISVSNIGTGSDLFIEKVGSNLRFRTILGSDKLTVTQNDDDITLDTNTIKEIVLQGNTGYSVIDEDNTTVTFLGGKDIYIQSDNNTITIGSTGSLFTDPEPRLSTDLDLNLFNIKGKGNINIEGSIVANSLNGTLQGSVIGNLDGNSVGVHTGIVYGDLYGTIYGRSIFDVEREFQDIDFGSYDRPINTALQLLIYHLNLDLGYTITPNTINIDMGIINDNEPILIEDNGEEVLLGAEDTILIS
jgi:hypothetical protein